ncbi:SH3 domain-containing protein, partial [Sphingomonas sp.]|uniref:SH3 domain-containing protein n=1 Tax=Sphingomonas sp. TaxID=28214 RepID=UPI001DD3766E
DMVRFRARVFGGRADDGDTLMKVAVASGLNLRSGPGTQFAASELLPLGTLVEPLEVDGNWHQVNVLGPDGTPRATGWVHGGFLTPA